MAAFEQYPCDALWEAIGVAGPFPHSHYGTDLVDSDEEVRAEHGRRRSFIVNFGYAVPTPAAIETIADFFGDRCVLEVCAGRGLWALLLNGLGLAIIATDVALPLQPPYIPVETRDAAEAVDAHPECSGLMLVWPPLGSNAAHHSVARFEGDRLVIVGDRRFIATRELYAELDSSWTLAKAVNLPSWQGLHDEARLYERTVGQS